MQGSTKQLKDADAEQEGPVDRRQTAAKALEFPLGPYSLWLCEYYFLTSIKVIVWGKTTGPILSFCRCCALGDPRAVLRCTGQSPMSSQSCFLYLESGTNDSIWFLSQSYGLCHFTFFAQILIHLTWVPSWTDFLSFPPIKTDEWQNHLDLHPSPQPTQQSPNTFRVKSLILSNRQIAPNHPALI